MELIAQTVLTYTCNYNIVVFFFLYISNKPFLQPFQNEILVTYGDLFLYISVLNDA